MLESAAKGHFTNQTEIPMTQQGRPPWSKPPEGIWQHPTRLRYEKPQMQPQFTAESPVATQTPAEPFPAALTQPGMSKSEAFSPGLLDARPCGVWPTERSLLRAASTKRGTVQPGSVWQLETLP